MRNKLLITTALVAVMSATNVYAEALPTDASNLTTGKYIVEDTGQKNIHTGDIKISEDASLEVRTYADINAEQDTITDSHVFNVNGNMEIGDADNGGGSLSVKRDDDKKPFMTVNGNLTVNNGASVDMSSNSDYFSTIIVSENADIKGGNIKMNNAEIFVNKDLNISGGNIELQNSGGLYLSETTDGNINISGGTINGAEIGNYGKGDVNISGGEVTATDIGAEQGSITISNGIVNMVKVDGIRSEGLYARDNMTIKGGTVNMSGNENLIWGKNIKMTGGTLNIKDSTAFITPNTVNIDGGTINIAENSSLGWAKASGDNFTFDTTVGENSIINLGSQATLNLDGILNTHLNSAGNINFKNNAAKIAGNVNMTNGGVLNVGLNKATIGGDITFDAGSTLKMSVTDEGEGLLSARNIYANEGSKLALTVSKTMEINDTATVKLFETAGKLDNNFTNEISNNRYKITSIDGGTYNIKYENSASDVVADAGGSVNNASTAEAWDSMVKSGSANAQAKAVANVLNDLSQHDKQAYVAALTAVAPEVAPMVQKTQTETANQVFGAVGTRLTGGSISTGSEGMSSGDNIFERVAVWVQGMFNHSKLDDTSKAKGFDADSSGVAMGIEKFVTDDVKVGAGYAYTNTDIDGFMRSTDVDTHTAIWYVNGIATYGWSDYSEDRNVGGQNINADYDVETFGLQAMTGYDMQVKNFGLTPEVGLRYVHIKQDAYTDGTESDVSGNDSDILTGVIGAKVNKTFALDNGMLIKPEARIAATYDLFNDDVNSVVTLANGSAYAVEGEALDRFGMEFGAGVTAEVNDNVEFALGYEGKFREDYQDHTGLINLKYKF